MNGYLRESLLKWLFLAMLGLVDVIWLSLSDFHFVYQTATAPPVICGIFLAAAWCCWITKKQIGLFVLFDSLAQLCFLPSAGGVLSYLVLSTGLPFIDQHLSRFDYLLGFDWPRYVTWVQGHPVLDIALRLIYTSWAFEWILVPLILAYRHEERVRELCAATFISVCATLLISMLYPAISAYPFYTPSNPGIVAEIGVPDLFALRDGSLRTIDLGTMDGLVSIPSFHAVGAFLFIHAFRGYRILFPVSFVLNSAILVSTLSAGGHYLVDVLAAAVLALLSIVLYRQFPLISLTFLRREPQHGRAVA